MKVTTKGYIEVWWTTPAVDQLISRHRDELEALESATTHAATQIGEQTYELRYPNKIVKAYGILSPGGDTEAPSQVTGLSGVALGATSVRLSWSAATDNIGVTGYQVWRNEVPLISVDALTYDNTGLTPSTAYTYKVAAYDAGGNVGPFSASVIVTTSANATPIWVTIAQQDLTPGVGYFYDLGARVSDADGDAISVTQVSGTLPTGVSYNPTLKTLSGTPTTVQSTSATFRASDGIATANVTVSFVVLNADTTAPSVPGGLAGDGSGGELITLTWTASSDTTVASARTSGLAGYKVYRDGALRATLGAVTTYNDSNVAANVTYSYTVSAFDAAGNESAQTAAVQVSTAQFGWTIPDTPFSVPGTFYSGTAGQSYDVSVYANDPQNVGVYSITSQLKNGVATTGWTVNADTGVITVPSSLATPAATDSYSIVVDLATSAESDWLLRSTGAGVVWLHDFRSYNEVALFSGTVQIVNDSGTVLKSGLNQDPVRGDYNTYETPSGYQNTFLVLPGETKKTGWPDTLPGVDSGYMIIEQPDAIAWNGYPEGTYFRWNNATTPCQVVYPDGTVLPSPTTGYTTYSFHRFRPGNGWMRPLAPLTGATNGRGVDDPAANGTLTKYAYPDSSGGVSAVSKWQANPRGFWAHPTEDSGSGAVLGNEFWLQMRVWVDPNQFAARLPVQTYTTSSVANQIPRVGIWDSPFNPYPGQQVEGPPSGKLFMLARNTELTGEWVHNCGPQTSTHLNPPERVAYRTYPHLHYTMTGAGYPLITYSTGSTHYQTNPAHSGGYHATCNSGQDISQPNKCWETPSGEWWTIMVHFKPGRTNIPYQTPTNLDTLVEVRVARWGETTWTYIFYDDARAWYWDTDTGKPKGMSTLRLNTYRNDAPSFIRFAQAFTQVIFSTQEIPCPQVY